MEASKKLLIVIVLIGLIPLLLIAVFFFYKIRAGVENSQHFLKSMAERKSSHLERIQSPKSSLEKLAEHPYLLRYLEQANLEQRGRIPAKGENPLISVEKERVLGCVREFRSQYPEFEEIILKNPETGTVYLSVPDGAAGVNLPGSRIVITIPVSVKSQATPALLLGILSIDTLAVSEKVRNKKALTGARRKWSLFFVWFFLAISIILPFFMFLVYRQMKKKLAPYLLNPQSRHQLRRTNGSGNSEGKNQSE